MLFRRILIFEFWIFWIASCCSAGTIFETGILGPVGVTRLEILSQGVPSTSVENQVFTGTIFELTRPATVTRIGGHFVGGYEPNQFFGAIVALSGPSDFPDSEDLSTPDVLGVAQLIFPHPSDEVFGDLRITLEPNWYALVFGSGLFNTDGIGGAVRNNFDIGEQTYIGWQANGTGWFDLAELASFVIFENHRFVIEGTFVPEPTTLLSVLVAMSSFSFWRRSRQIGGRSESDE